LGNADAGGAVTSFITRNVFNEKIFYYNVLENSRGNLEE